MLFLRNFTKLLTQSHEEDSKNMKKKECPSCAMEIDNDEAVCPICQYEFPPKSKINIMVAVLLIIVFILFFILGIWKKPSRVRRLSNELMKKTCTYLAFYNFLLLVLRNTLSTKKNKIKAEIPTANEVSGFVVPKIFSGLSMAMFVFWCLTKLDDTITSHNT